MYFRGQKKLQGEVSLSESIDTDREGNALQLMDVVGVDDTMLEDLHDRDSALSGRHGASDPERGGRFFRDFPELCIPPRLM